MPLTQEQLDSIDQTVASYGHAATGARVQAVNGANDNPDEAAKSLQLSQASGVHPSIVDMDPQNFEEQWKQRTAGEAVAADPHLQEYINSYPLAHKISNDDYEQLSKAGFAVKRLGKDPFSEGAKAFLEALGGHEGTPSVPERIFEGAKRAGSILTMPWAHTKELSDPAFLSELLSPFGELTGAALKGAATTLSTPFENLGQPGLARDVSAMIEWAMQRGDINLAHAPELHEKVKEGLDHGLPYIANREVPPVGVLEDFDKAHKERAKADGEALKEAEREAGKSATRERSPDAFEAFLRSPTEGRTIGISADAVRELYGDKPPAPDDGLLGWVPGLEDQLRTAEAIGGDIEVPLAGWLAKTEPEVQNALHDHVRVRPEGMTLFEGKGPEAKAKGLGVLPEEEGAPAVETPKASPSKSTSPSVQGPPNSEFAGTAHNYNYFAREDGLIERRDVNTGQPETLAQDGLWHKQVPNNIGYEVFPNKKYALSHLKDVEGVSTEKEPQFEKAEPLVQNADDLARKESALAPLVESGETLRLKLVKEEAPETIGARADPDEHEIASALGIPKENAFRTYAIHGDRGKVGEVVTQLTSKKMIYVENINAGKDAEGQPNALGHKQIAGLLKQLKTEYPEATSIGGYRVSGARAKAPGREAGKADATEFVQIPLRAGEKEIASFAEAMGLKGWDSVEGQVAPGRVPETAAQGGKPVELGDKTVEPLMHFSAKDLLDNINLDHLTGVPKVLGSFFRGKLSELVGDVEVRVISQADMDEYTAKYFGRRPGTGGFYSPDDHFIALTDQILNSSDHVVTHVVIHEAAHAATVRAMDASPILKQHVRDMMDEVKAYLEEFEPETLKRHDYAFINEREFLAEAFGKPAFQDVLATSHISPELAERMGMSKDTKTMWDAVRNFVAGTLEKLLGIRPDATIMDGVLKLGEEFEKQIKKEAELRAHYENLKQEWLQRGGESDLKGKNDEAVKQLQKDMEELLRTEGLAFAPPEDPLFENAKAIGMTKESFGRYQKLIEKRNAEDEARQLAKATKEAELRQTAEWKAAEKEARAEVTEQINQRPDIAADDFLREGPFTSEKTGRIRLATDSLTEEQKAELPKHYYAKGGTDPSALAGLFGYSSGEALVKRLANLNAVREGLGLDPREYKRTLVDKTVERQTASRFGNLEQNILDEARDSVRTATQMELLHEETMALGLNAGVEPSLSAADIKAAIKKQFGTIPVSQAKDPMNFIRTSGRAGKAVEEALLRGDAQEAFRQKQRQYYSELMVKEAQALQKEFSKNEKFLKRFSQRQVSTVSQEYTDQIHGIMGQIGSPVKRSVQDLQGALKGTPLQDFVTTKEADLREVPVADFLFDPAFKKDLASLSVEDFRAVDSSLKALAHNGRSELQVEKAGEKADLEAVRKSMVEQLEGFRPSEPPPLGQGRGKLLGVPSGSPKKALRTFIAAHLQMETLLNRWDRFDPQGVFNQYVMRPLAESSNRLAALEREYSKLVMDLKDKENLKETIENPLFIDPLSKTIDNPDGAPFIMARKHLRAVIANMGNASNLEKLTKGYDVSPEALHAWVGRVAKKADWDFVQKQGDIFAKLKKESDRMYERLAGIAPESIETTPLDTPHGRYEGWYHPIIYDRLREGGSKKLMGRSGLEEPEYFRATTPAGYTKARTGYTAPLSLELDEVQTRMKQMIHDIAMREAVINAGKIFYDKDIRSAIAKHSFLGPEVKDMLVPYLKDVANHSNIDSAAAHVGAQWSEFFRQNIISTLVGLNPGTVLKHGPTAAIQSLQEVGPINFAREVKDLLKPGGSANWKFAMETSEELQRRHRNYSETLGGGYREAFQEQNLRTIVQHVASYPVAISDLLSAVPTWLAEYRTRMEAGASKGDAVFAADRSIRRAHGSTAMTNRPVVMRGGPTAQWFSSVFGFFSHIMNRQVEMVWRAGDTLGKVKNGELSEALADTPKLASSLFAYVLWPALVEEMVSPLTNDQHESWGVWAGKALVKDLSASWIGIRDVTQAILTGHDPSMGLIGTMFKTGSDLSRDIVSEATKGKDRAGRIIEHGAAALGAATGLATAQMGRTAEFAYNVATGKDKPKGLGQWLHGLRFGASKAKRK